MKEKEKEKAREPPKDGEDDHTQTWRWLVLSAQNPNVYPHLVRCNHLPAPDGMGHRCSVRCRFHLPGPIVGQEVQAVQ